MMIFQNLPNGNKVSSIQQIGDADHFGQMSGSNVTFLFPDHTTAMTGTFSKSEMFLGQVSFIQVGHS